MCLIFGIVGGFVLCSLLSANKYEEQQEEIAKLKTECFNAQFKKYKQEFLFFKTEIIQEFAERLRNRVTGIGVHSAIDCVLQEMEDENNG